MLSTILELVVYVIVGLVIMIAGYALIDLILPADFPKEITEGNKAIGWVSAGIYIGLGLVIRSSVSTITMAEKELALITGVVDTLIYAVLGIVFFMVAYFLVDLVNRRFNFNVEIAKKNEAAGIMVFGIFVGIALIISGVIQ
ncbi:putative membrane protein [Lachnospiraceae bacterium]|nr:putative membrane protein [Lachnospiraceae bacterium]